MPKSSFQGNYHVYIYNEEHILTNCLRALADFRSYHGEVWPAKIVINRNNRLSLSFGADIEILKPAARETNWPILNALYLCSDAPLRDPAIKRIATVPQTHIREPIDDVYQQVYRRRAGTDVGYTIKLPTK